MSVKNYDLIRSLDSLAVLCEKLLAEGKPVGFDVETGYLGPNREKGALFIDWDQQFVTGFSISNDPNMARYVPLAHDYGNNLPEREAWEVVKPVLETLPIIAHNMKFEMRNLRALERKGRGPRIDINVHGDSQIQSYVLGHYQWHGLKGLVKQVFGHEMAQLKSLFPDSKEKDLKALRFNTLDLTSEVVSYACEDAAWCLALHEHFDGLVKAQRPFMYSLESRIMELLCDIEDYGHAVDWDALSEQEAYGHPFHEHMAESARKMLSEMSGTDESTLNFNSNKQMADVLYERIGLTTTVMTKGGKSGVAKMSTNAIALEGLSRQHPPVKKILETREVLNLAGRLTKWKNDYSLAYDKRVHPSFNQVKGEGDDGSQAPASGRFSANDPAIQQLPKQWRWTILPVVVDGGGEEDDDRWNQIVNHPATSFGKHFWNGNFRDFCVAAPGCYLLGYDYSQIELRCMAGMSQEPALLEAFTNDVDIHTTTGAMMLGKTLEQATKKDRAIGKTMNFALLYGMGEKSLGERLALSPAEAEALYAKYFEAFTLVDRWMSETKRFGWDNGFVETHFKRRVTVWEAQSDFRSLRSKADRLFVNAPVQGTAADYMKIAMLRAKAALQERGWWGTKVRMINNLHDALTFEADNDVDPNELRMLLEPAVVWRNDTIASFPKIVADWEMGQKWGSLAKWESAEATFDGENWILESAPEPEPVAEPVPVEIVEPEPAPEEEALDLIVEITEMPSQDGLTEFMRLVTQHPGPSPIVLHTPQGKARLSYTTGLTPQQQASISLAFGGAKVYYPDHTKQFDIEGMTL